MKNQIVVTSPVDCVSILRSYSKKRTEHFVVISLDSGRNVIAKKCIAIGGDSRVVISAKTIFWEACSKKASAIIIAHNHPGGNVQPSADDVKTTEMVMQASELLGITLLDHIIIGRYSYFSFLEHDLVVGTKTKECMVAEKEDA